MWHALGRPYICMMVASAILAEHVPADHLFAGSTGARTAWSVIVNSRPETTFAVGEFVWMRDHEFGSRKGRAKRFVEVGFRVHDTFMGDVSAGETVSVWSREPNVAYPGSNVARWAVRIGVGDGLDAASSRLHALGQRLSTVQPHEQLEQSGRLADAIQTRLGRILRASVRLDDHGHPFTSAPYLFFEVGGVITAGRPYLLTLRWADEAIARRRGLPENAYFIGDIYWGEILWGDEATKLWDELPRQYERIERLRTENRQSSFR